MKSIFLISVLCSCLFFSCENKIEKFPSSDKEIDRQIDAIIQDMDAVKYAEALEKMSKVYAIKNLYQYPEKKYYLLCFESEILYYSALFDLGADKANEAILLVNKDLDSNKAYIGNAYNLLGINAENFLPAYQLPDIYKKSWQNTTAHSNRLLSKQAHIASNLGQIYYKAGELAKAEEWLSKSNTLSHSDSLWRTLSINYATQASIYTKQQNWYQSDAFLDSSFYYYKKKKDNDLFLFYLHAKVERQLAEGNTSTAIHTIRSGDFFLDSASDISQMGVFDYLKSTRQLATDYHLKGIESALLVKEKKLYKEVDSTRQETKAQIVQWHTANQALLIEQEKQTYIAKKKLHRNREILRFSLVGFFALALSASSLFYTLFQKRKAERLKFENEKKAMELHIELAKTKEKYNAILSERTRISKEFHDGVAPNLSAIKLICEAINQKSTGDEMLMQMPALIDNTINEIKFLINEINPQTLLNEGLETALKRFLAMYKTSQNVVINLSSNLGKIRLDKEVELNIYRILQEAVHNALKHTNTNKIEIMLDIAESFLDVKIQDFGKDKVFDFDTNSQGNGLSNMKSRARLIDAEITVISELGKGSLMQIRVPLPK